MSYSTKQSEKLFEAAQKHIPGGVNSPVRAFKGVGGTPVFFDHAKGAYAYDADGNRYIDYVGSWGPMILGHNAEVVLDALKIQMEKGLSFGAPTAVEIEMAEAVCKLVPSMDMVRMVNSGTEATMSAIRLARGYTGRDKIVKFEGCYHGHADSLLVKAGSGMLTLGVPTSPGVPASVAEHTLTLDYNNLDSVRECFAKYGDQIACVIIEPVAGNMNCIPGEKSFLQGLSEICTLHGSVLIFDEVMSGFRVALGGAQEYYGITPDMTCLGKIIGGGLPVGAFGGKREIMEYLAPLGPVYQAGTLSGNPLAMAAGLAMLKAIQKPGFHKQLTDRVEQLLAGFKAAADKHGVPFAYNNVGAMFGIFFTELKEVKSFRDVADHCDTGRFNKFFHGMLKEGIYLAPSAFEAAFMSIAHSEDDIAATIAATDKVMATL